MPISLFSIPAHIRDSIIQKIDLPDFVNFQESSRSAHIESQNVRTMFTVRKRFASRDPVIFINFLNNELVIKFFKNVEGLGKPFRRDISQIPIRFEGFECLISIFTDEFCKALIKFLQQTNSLMNSISFFIIDCSPESLKQLADTQKVKELMYSGSLNPAYARIEAINKILKFFRVYMDEDEILVLKACNFKISASNLTSFGANQILKELLDGKRIIKSCEIGKTQRLHHEVILKGIPISRRYSDGDQNEIVYIGSSKSYKVIICPNKFIISEEPPTEFCLKRKLSTTSPAAKYSKK